MSTRHMKKVYGNDIIFEKDNDTASDTEISVTNDTKSKSFNVFDVVCTDINVLYFVINIYTFSLFFDWRVDVDDKTHIRS